ncbi:MAG: CRISPR-associated protein Csx15 [Anaerolineales bacterium]
MIVINFSHPLTEAQRAQIAQLAGQPVERVIERMPHFDHDAAFAEQACALVDGVGLSAAEWQTLPILLVPPSYSLIASVVLAELHGRMGRFPPVVRMRPVDNGLAPTLYEVAEIIPLQAVRDAARRRRL